MKVDMIGAAKGDWLNRGSRRLAVAAALLMVVPIIAVAAGVRMRDNHPAYRNTRLRGRRLSGDRAGTTASAGQFGPELVANGGFEDYSIEGDFTGWTWDRSNRTTVEPVTTTHSGISAARLTAKGSPAVLTSSQIAVIPGTKYVLGFWTRGDGHRGGQYHVYDVSNRRKILGYSPTHVTGKTYSHRRVTFRTPAGCVRIYLDLLTYWNGSVYFDDVSLRRAPTTSGESKSIH